jgi:hypothetical protein
MTQRAAKIMLVSATIAGLGAFYSVGAQEYVPTNPCRAPHFVDLSRRMIMKQSSIYSACVKSSHENDDCSAAFKELRRWQNSFVKAVNLSAERAKLKGCD